MLKLTTDNGIVKVYATTIESAAIDQIKLTANSSLGVGANIRMMPDTHLGSGCCIGTTMLVTDKVCPNLVGVDIGCGVQLAKFNINFTGQLEKLDKVIRTHIPFGMNNNSQATITESTLAKMRCWKQLPNKVKQSALCALGSLGGGNHFIEAYEDGYISVHSGSRNIGLNVAKYYQNLAITRNLERSKSEISNLISNTPLEQRERVHIEHMSKPKIPAGLEYLDGEDAENYLHDQQIMVSFAQSNRKTILEKIAKGMKAKIISTIESTHNYIDKSLIIRKGAISARENEDCLIPLNMRDGLLICKGKGNSDWNFSAPHGAGRLYGRRAAKDKFTVSAYKQSMQGIYSTCIDASTLDEAPFVYKDMHEIISAIEPTVDIVTRLIPIFNFKASE